MFVLCVHFTLVVIFANPYTTTKHKLDYYAEWYVYPYFSQAWNLFVPTPATNYRLFVTYENNGPQSKDIFQEILLKHQTNRLAGYGPVLLAFSNSIYYFETATKLQHALNGPVRNDVYFQVIENSVLNYLSHTEGKKIEKVKMILLIESVASNDRKAYFN